MTTIAACGKFIAADTLLTIGSRVTHGPKLWRVGKVIFGGSGDSALIETVRAWIAQGMTIRRRPKLKDDAEFDGLIWRNRVLYYLESALIPIEICPPFAIGSGSEYALAFMRSGVDAKKAVERVIDLRLDPATAGSVRSFPAATRGT